jgi:hypothetical protein
VLQSLGGERPCAERIRSDGAVVRRFEAALASTGLVPVAVRGMYLDGSLNDELDELRNTKSIFVARRRGHKLSLEDLTFWSSTRWPRGLTMRPVLPKERFGTNLRRLRKAAGLTQMELGNRCKMQNSGVISR